MESNEMTWNGTHQIKEAKQEIKSNAKEKIFAHPYKYQGEDGNEIAREKGKEKEENKSELERKSNWEEEEGSENQTRRGPGGPTLATYGAGKERIVTLKDIPVWQAIG